MITIQAIYKLLSKKQKGIFLDTICNHSEFSKSKEWVRKYIVGAYLNKDLKFEQLALQCAENLGFGTNIIKQQVEFNQPEISIFKKKLASERVQKEPLIVTFITTPKNELEILYIEGLNTEVSSRMGTNWFVFLRRCQKNIFNRSNPFVAAINLIENLREKQITCLPKYQEVSELNDIFQQSKNQSDYIKYQEDWERFGQVARHKYCINPFIYLQQII